MNQFNNMMRFYKSIASLLKRRGLRIVADFTLVIFVLLTPACYDSYGVAELKLEQEDYQGAIERSKASIVSVQKQIDEIKPQVEEVKEVKDSLKGVLKENRVFQEEIEDYEIRLRGTMAVLKACQSAFKIKVNIEQGKKFESIRLKNGQTLTKVVYRGFGEKGLSLAHSGGVGVFALEQMPEEIEQYFVMPPSKPISAVDPKLILSRKPDALKTHAQIQKERNLKNNEEYNAAILKQKIRDEKRDRERAKNSAEMAKKRAEYEKKEKEIDSLIGELNRYQDSYNQHLVAVKAQKKTWEKMSLPPSRADRQSTIDGFTERGRTLSLKINELKKKLETARQ